MINNDKILGMLGLASRAGKLVFGTDSCLEFINKNKIKLLIIAHNSSDRTKLRFREIATKKNISIYEIYSIEELSKAIGKKNKAIVGVIDINFSKEIIKRLKRG